ncbi:hypothetical protein N9Y16_08725 [Gammaproteobacteria bacterium]|nr:hypothetical protein [Gammaproteobacteria bacterium]
MMGSILIGVSVSADIIDCDSALSETERRVCGNATLRSLNATLDRAMTSDERARRNYSDLPAELRKGIKQCRQDTSCLVDFYEKSIFDQSLPKDHQSSTVALIRCPNIENYQNCFGTYVWPSGQIYSGLWRENKRHGLGKQVYPNGDIVIGFWNRDELHGEVKIKFSSGKTYYGEIKHGRYVGPATIYDNGLRYTGVFISDDQSQIFRGRQYFFDGTSVSTDFINLLEPLDADLAKEGDHIDASKSKNLTLSEAFVFLMLILSL